MSAPSCPGRRRVRRRAARLVAVTGLLMPLLLLGSGCSSLRQSTPSCQSLQRLALVAQSVPSATFVPCLGQLPPGWSVTAFSVQRGHTDFSLLSDRAAGRAVVVRFQASCPLPGAVPTNSRGPGIRTYIRLDSIDPRYAGTLLDQFSRGCVTYRFNFQRGSHIPLVQDFENAVRLVSRHTLRLELRTELGLELDR